MSAQPGVDPRLKPTRTREEPRPIGVPGMALCRSNATAACRAPHKVYAGLPRRARCGLLLGLRGRPPALEQRGRSPSIHHPRDHAARATLGRWDALAAQRPRRPVMRAGSGTTAATGTGAVSMGDGTNPHRYTPSPAGRRRYKHRNALCSAHVSWAMEPTRVGTPPSPAGRRRYKHRNALCSVRVSRTMETTRIGAPPGGPLRSAVPASKQAGDDRTPGPGLQK